jgi:hypothetical protein
MKNVTLLLMGIFVLHVHSVKAQSSYQTYQKCLENLRTQEAKESEGLIYKWFEDNPNPQKYVTLACDGHYPRFQCRLHKKQCYGFCTCGDNYNKESSALSQKFQQRKENCENAYQEQLKAEEEKRIAAEKKEREERERKEKEEKARKEKEVKEKEAKEKAAKANTKSSSEKGKSNANNQPKESPEMIKSRLIVQRRVNSEEAAKKSLRDEEERMQGLMSIFSNDDRMNGSSFVGSNVGLNITLGFLPYTNVPMYENVQFQATTSTSIQREQYAQPTTVTNYLGPAVQAELYLLNNKFLSLRGFTHYYLGSARIGGETDMTGSTSEFAYGGEVGVGYRGFKVFGGISYGSRDVSQGSYYHGDIANADINTDGAASYTFERLTGGLTIHFNKYEGEKHDYNMERFIRLSVFQEKPDFNTEELIWGAGLRIRGFFELQAEYFPYYPTAGYPIFPVRNEQKLPMWSVHLSKTFTLFNGNY